MAEIQTEYIPGKCNIGPGEIARRRNFGLAALVVLFVSLGGLMLARVNPLWRLFIIFPAASVASGFLQAYFHFCSGYARIGAYNFGEPGERHDVEDEASKAKDRKKGNQITLYAVIFGAMVALAAAFLM
ncbi:MAG TPA: hypothetical protein VMF88_13810 [Bacteroidota bacterium]|nr:hypothetical protein [Bacteroidota bacterium]